MRMPSRSENLVVAWLRAGDGGGESSQRSSKVSVWTGGVWCRMIERACASRRRVCADETGQTTKDGSRCCKEENEARSCRCRCNAENVQFWRCAILLYVFANLPRNEISFPPRFQRQRIRSIRYEPSYVENRKSVPTWTTGIMGTSFLVQMERQGQANAARVLVSNPTWRAGHHDLESHNQAMCYEEHMLVKL
jgi:hypothetical protein